MMPIGERARGGMGGEVCPQPLLLRGASLAATDLFAIRVQHDQVPGTDVIAVVALGRIAGRRSKVAVVVDSRRRAVFVVPDRWMRDGFDAPPRGPVSLLKLGQGPLLVLEIAQRKNRRRTHAHQ